MSEDTTEKPKDQSIVGSVTEALPNTLFRVRTEDGRDVMAYISGRMRIHRIRVLVGDKVALEDNPYGGKLRIVKRM
jgi:translation initiation factor IF-1